MDRTGGDLTGRLMGGRISIVPESLLPKQRFSTGKEKKKPEIFSKDGIRKKDISEATKTLVKLAGKIGIYALQLSNGQRFEDVEESWVEQRKKCRQIETLDEVRNAFSQVVKSLHPGMLAEGFNKPACLKEFSKCVDCAEVFAAERKLNSNILWDKIKFIHEFMDITNQIPASQCQDPSEAYWFVYLPKSIQNAKGEQDIALILLSLDEQFVPEAVILEEEWLESGQKKWRAACKKCKTWKQLKELLKEFEDDAIDWQKAYTEMKKCNKEDKGEGKVGKQGKAKTSAKKRHAKGDDDEDEVAVETPKRAVRGKAGSVKKKVKEESGGEEEEEEEEEEEIKTKGRTASAKKKTSAAKKKSKKESDEEEEEEEEEEDEIRTKGRTASAKKKTSAAKKKSKKESDEEEDDDDYDDDDERERKPRVRTPAAAKKVREDRAAASAAKKRLKERDESQSEDEEEEPRIKSRTASAKRHAGAAQKKTTEKEKVEGEKAGAAQKKDREASEEDAKEDASNSVRKIKTTPAEAKIQTRERSAEASLSEKDGEEEEEERPPKKQRNASTAKKNAQKKPQSGGETESEQGDEDERKKERGEPKMDCRLKKDAQRVTREESDEADNEAEEESEDLTQSSDTKKVDVQNSMRLRASGVEMLLNPVGEVSNREPTAESEATIESGEQVQFARRPADNAVFGGDETESDDDGGDGKEDQGDAGRAGSMARVASAVVQEVVVPVQLLQEPGSTSNVLRVLARRPTSSQSNLEPGSTSNVLRVQAVPYRGGLPARVHAKKTPEGSKKQKLETENKKLENSFGGQSARGGSGRGRSSPISVVDDEGSGSAFVGVAQRPTASGITLVQDSPSFSPEVHQGLQQRGQQQQQQAQQHYYSSQDSAFMLAAAQAVSAAEQAQQAQQAQQINQAHQAQLLAQAVAQAVSMGGAGMGGAGRAQLQQVSQDVGLLNMVSVPQKRDEMGLFLTLAQQQQYLLLQQQQQAEQQRQQQLQMEQYAMQYAAALQHHQQQQQQQAAVVQMQAQQMQLLIQQQQQAMTIQQAAAAALQQQQQQQQQEQQQQLQLQQKLQEQQQQHLQQQHLQQQHLQQQQQQQQQLLLLREQAQQKANLQAQEVPALLSEEALKSFRAELEKLRSIEADLGKCYDKLSTEFRPSYKEASKLVSESSLAGARALAEESSQYAEKCRQEWRNFAQSMGSVPESQHAEAAQRAQVLWSSVQEAEIVAQHRKTFEASLEIATEIATQYERIVACKATLNEKIINYKENAHD